MKKLALWGYLFFLHQLVSYAQTPENPDKTLSPYFWVKSDDKSLDQLPLKHTGAEVNIAGVIADVKVTQIYANEGKKPLEAIYVFPGSTRAAVYAMTMTIGQRKLVAKIEKKETARQAYEQAKLEGKTASLLEQQNPNVFQMNVANILPGDKITVELRYTELLVPSEGVYEFAYPTVVGPRYSNQPLETATNDDRWVANPYLKSGEKPTYTFDINTRINAGMPIQEVACLSHKVNVNFADASTAKISLNKELDGGNRDYILKYRLAGNQVQSGLLIYEGENATADATEGIHNQSVSEKFFLLMMQPPKKPENTQIPPREYVFIVDISGSMNGYPIETAQKLLKNLTANLRPNDRFNLMLFAGSNAMLAENSLPATAENIEQANYMMGKQRGGGSTELLPALKRALALKGTEGYSRTFVVITDGYITLEREAFDLIKSNLNQANLFAFGIGTGVNRYLIEGMARAGMGEPFVVTQASEAPQVAEKFRNYIQNPVLTNIKVHYEGIDVYDIEPISIPDVFAERPVIIYGKFKNYHPLAKITLSGLNGNQTYVQTVALAEADNEQNQAIRYLWARQRIQSLDDYTKNFRNAPDGQKRVEEVTRLGLEYNLLTAYTSFIAIDPTVRNKEGNTTVQQPLPLPQGVENEAINYKPTTRSLGNTSTFAPTYQRGGEVKKMKDKPSPKSVVDKEESNTITRGGKLEPKKDVKTDSIKIDKRPSKAQNEVLRIEHEVDQGDYLYKISQKYGVKMDEIRQWNNLKSDDLQLGQVLVIYAEFAKEIHEVLEGESLFQIGILYGVKVADILKWNNLENDKLHLGQKLTIYILAHRKKN